MGTQNQNIDTNLYFGNFFLWPYLTDCYAHYKKVIMALLSEYGT